MKKGELGMPYQQLRLADGTTIAKVAPARGALVTDFRVADRSILALDRATFDDPARNVRGGIPVLFPQAGRLQGDFFVQPELENGGTPLQQHGFAREQAWTVRERSDDRLVMTLSSDERTMAGYPYPYELTQTVMVQSPTLLLTLTIHNPGVSTMPIAPGWHPYFSISPAEKSSVSANILGFRPPTSADDVELNYGLPFGGDVRVDFPHATISITASPEFHHLQVWTLPDAPFLCIEPWVGPANALNHPDQRLAILPGQTIDLWMKIGVTLRER